ncbi:MAG: rhodanese-like domain-containing protein [Chloroflexota bacterium]
MPLTDITIEDYQADYEGQDNHVLIDVREIEEWEDVRLPNTVNIPLSELGERLDEIPTDTPVVLVCRSGGRSAMAGDQLAANGYNNMFNLLEGTMGWVRRELPTESGEA